MKVKKLLNSNISFVIALILTIIFSVASTYAVITKSFSESGTTQIGSVELSISGFDSFELNSISIISIGMPLLDEDISIMAVGTQYMYVRVYIDFSTDNPNNQDAVDMMQASSGSIPNSNSVVYSWIQDDEDGYYYLCTNLGVPVGLSYTDNPVTFLSKDTFYLPFEIEYEHFEDGNDLMDIFIKAEAIQTTLPVESVSIDNIKGFF